MVAVIDAAGKMCEDDYSGNNPDTIETLRTMAQFTTIVRRLVGGNDLDLDERAS